MKTYGFTLMNGQSVTISTDRTTHDDLTAATGRTLRATHYAHHACVCEDCLPMFLDSDLAAEIIPHAIDDADDETVCDCCGNWEPTLFEIC